MKSYQPNIYISIREILAFILGLIAFIGGTALVCYEVMNLI